MLFTSEGKSIRFSETEVRPTGRTSRGVRGILSPRAKVVSAFSLDPQTAASKYILSASEHGYGKCTPVSDFNIQSRGGMGVIALARSERNGAMIGALLVNTEDEAILLSKQGMILRTKLASIPVTSRNTQGVRLVRLNPDDTLAYLEAIDSSLSVIEEETSDSVIEPLIEE
jgi:DNA gyrase subunit A